ncbi:MAG: selenide, water dikinase SelD [Bacteroidetes bacterium]|nr:selenide, water dikinase SelD [Bacteroidota bacterium]
MNNKFDLLSTVEYGGCSAKLSPKELSELLKSIPLVKDSNIMVDIETHDDAGVYKLNDETALIVTTDFFPPVCSDAEEFGQIAAANALSDVYAMGGKPLLALNLNMFPSKNIPLTVLKDILIGGQSKITESGAFIMGGHTIDDAPPKYGLAVVGTIHPDKLIKNSGLREGDVMILTKPLGVGALIAGQRMGIANQDAYKEALEQMKILNKRGAELMQKYNVKGATDVTGFGLVGHAQKMAEASGVTMEIESKWLPVLPQVMDLINQGCIGGATFRNLDYSKGQVRFMDSCSTDFKMLCCDAQTSGGLLMGVEKQYVSQILSELHNDSPFTQSAVVGEVTKLQDVYCIVK